MNSAFQIRPTSMSLPTLPKTAPFAVSNPTTVRNSVVFEPYRLASQIPVCFENPAEQSDGLCVQRRRMPVLLVVDDDDVDRERIRRFVSRFRVPVAVVDASSGQEALQRLSNNPVDIILLDYQLGDMTGTDLLSLIQDSERSPVPTIMVTGMGDEGTAVEAIRLGVFDYIPKRLLTLEALTVALESVLRQLELQHELREAQSRLQRLSLYDELTGLPNRTLLFDRLGQLLRHTERQPEQFTLLMLDLNLFKEVNDDLGHAAGDQVLATIGRRLEERSRRSDTISRMGGDEFVCVLPRMHRREDVLGFVEKLLATISAPIAIGDHVARVGASIGIVCYPENGIDASELLSNADCAMYRAKKTHSEYAFYSDDQPGQCKRRLTTSQCLAKGIEKEELCLYYQPKIDLTTLEIVGVEALVRWNYPGLGLVMPGEFIPSAERSGLIDRLTAQILKMGLDQIASWRAHGLRIKVAFNVSARTLNNRQFPDWLFGQLDERAMGYDEISLEITETALAASNTLAKQMLCELAGRGIEVSIDDFGSGFTSFRYIRDINIAELKIDRLFVKGICEGSRDAAIVDSMLLLADNLGIRVIAEGIETEEEWDYLQSIGCRCGQGFAIARPMDSTALFNWLLELNNVVKH